MGLSQGRQAATRDPTLETYKYSGSMAVRPGFQCSEILMNVFQ